VTTTPFTDANRADIEAVLGVLPGKKREKLLDSVRVIDESLAQGSWVKRGRVKAESGFYQGLLQARDYGPERSDFELHMCLSFGRGCRSFEAAVRRLHLPKNLIADHVRSWVALCNAKDAAFAELDEARPRPTVTPVGLSPKVTKTLKEMELDIDINSIRPAEIAYRLVPKERIDGTLIMKNGEYVMERQYYVKWERGTAFGQGRFGGAFSATTGAQCCEACGKPIPSGLFAPVQATDQKTGRRLGMWLGLDCARNIFGVQDVGIRRGAK
jgi:hypothetical protein